MRWNVWASRIRGVREPLSSYTPSKVPSIPSRQGIISVTSAHGVLRTRLVSHTSRLIIQPKISRKNKKVRKVEHVNARLITLMKSRTLSVDDIEYLRRANSFPKPRKTPKAPKLLISSIEKELPPNILLPLQRKPKETKCPWYEMMYATKGLVGEPCRERTSLEFIEGDGGLYWWIKAYQIIGCSERGRRLAYVIKVPTFSELVRQWVPDGLLSGRDRVLILVLRRKSTYRMNRACAKISAPITQL